jgi:hypothetical protein
MPKRVETGTVTSAAAKLLTQKPNMTALCIAKAVITIIAKNTNGR